MTTRDIKIDSKNLENSITKFDEKIKKVENTLHQISCIMNKIDGNNDTWKSSTAVAVHESYSELEKNFEKINAELTVYSIFLKETLEEYNEEAEKHERVIEEGSSDLDVN